MRQKTWLETEVQSQAKTEGDRMSRDSKTVNKGASERKTRDPNLDNPAVKKYRDIIHLQTNYLQREEIALTVKNVRIWEAVLLEWMLEGRNPKNVLSMLKIYRNMNGNG